MSETQNTLEQAEKILGDTFYIDPILAPLYRNSIGTDHSGMRIWSDDLLSEKGNEISEEKDEIFRIIERAGDLNFARDRAQMRVNFHSLIRHLKDGSHEDLPFPAQLRAILLDIKREYLDRVSALGYSQIEIEKEQELLRKMKNWSEGSKEDGGFLYDHLAQATRSFSKARSAIEAVSGPDSFLTSHQMDLLEYVVIPCHDLMKLLGTHTQIDPDHENIIEYIFRTYLPGKKITTRDGQVIEVTNADAHFCAMVASSHEDIYRMTWFAGLVTAFDEEPGERVDDPVSISRAISFFHAIDIFGDAFVLTAQGDRAVVTIDTTDEVFDPRFLDLVRRHIRLPGVDEEIWAKSKADVPSWGAHAINAISEMVGRLGPKISFDPESLGKVQEKVREIYKTAIDLLTAQESVDSKRIEYLTAIRDTIKLSEQ